MEEYIKHVKNTNNNLDSFTIIGWLNRNMYDYIDDNGNIENSKNLEEFLKHFIITIVKKFYKKIEYKIVKQRLKNHQFNKYGIYKYNEYFEKAITFSLEDIGFNIINKILFEIYIYSTTIYSFSNYYKYYQKNFKPISNTILDNIDNIILNENVFNNDFTINSYKLLSLGHLKKKNDIIIENPMNAYMRIALELTYNTNFNNIREIFLDIWHHKYYIPSTPMFYNSLKINYNMMSSCFILDVEDNIESIGNLYNKVINIMKFNSGIGIVLSKIRAKGTAVMGGEAVSYGIDRYIKSLILLSEQFKNEKKNRTTNINITLSIDHPDVLSFLDLKLNTKAEFGIPHNNLFQTISIPDEFIYRYLSSRPWYFISPENHINNVHLYDVHGSEYSDLYNKMLEDKNIKKIESDPKIILNKIVNTMIQTGGPFLFFKDVINATHNFDTIINGTNLCTEILIPSNDTETACCNIMSMNLKKFVVNNIFDYDKFQNMISRVVILLNKIINNTYYSHKSCKISNDKYRPLGIGIQGLANTLQLLDQTYDNEGKKTYKKIIETMYYAAVKTSNIYAKVLYKDYPKQYTNYEYVFKKFNDYQTNKHLKLQCILPDLAKHVLNSISQPEFLNTEFDELKTSIAEHGLVNSLFIALMPTSLSSGIYNNSESFEPYTNNVYKKTYSMYDIIHYNTFIIDSILSSNPNKINIYKELLNVDGDVNKLDISEELKTKLSKFITMNKIDVDDYIDFTTGIDAFVDQGISFNLMVKNNDNSLILKSIIKSWLYGKKTIYYYRTDLSVNPLVFNDNIQNGIQKIYSINCNSCT